jgi:hypothetical protein
MLSKELGGKKTQDGFYFYFFLFKKIPTSFFCSPTPQRKREMCVIWPVYWLPSLTGPRFLFF